jgi:ribosome biogenesis GTPase
VARRKKKNRVREREWGEKHEDAFSHDLKRHLRTNTAVASGSTAAEAPSDFQPNGLVISHSKKWAFVQIQGREELCRIDDNLVEKRSTILVPGDEVLIETLDDTSWVRAVAPRRSTLSRPAGQEARLAEQIYAANIDVLVIVAAAAKPAFKAGLVDRYLIAADVGGITPILCVNKMDLVEEAPGEIEWYRDLDVTVMQTSCMTGVGLDDLRGALEGKLSVFSGHSGVGKSSLLNSLEPGLDLATREVSDSTNKGKHTTTAARLYELEQGIRIIDTPGIRQLGLWRVTPEDLPLYFPEFGELGERCKFRDCTHTHEPNCAVLAALEEGRISRQRFGSYVRMRKSMEEEKQR